MIMMNIAALAWFNAQSRGVDGALLERSKEVVQREAKWTNDQFDQARNLLTSERGRAHRVRLGGYADDLHLAGTNHSEIRRARWLTELWSIALYMKLNAEKSHALGQVDLCVQGHALSQITEAKILGDVLNFKRDNWESLPMARGRIATFCGRLARIARLPGSKENRLEAIGTSAIPVLFGGEFTPLDPKQGNELRRKVWASARGGTKLPWTTAIEILMTTFSTSNRPDSGSSLYIRHELREIASS